MLRYVKAFHILGAIMFFGSILGHVTTGFIPAAKDDPQTALVIRHAIDVATTYLTLPGLVVLLLTGTILVVKGGRSLVRTRWLGVHAIFGLLIVINAAVFLYPGGQEILALASEIAASGGPLGPLETLTGREAAFGAVNVLLALAAVFLATIKPGDRPSQTEA